MIFFWGSLLHIQEKRTGGPNKLRTLPGKLATAALSQDPCETKLYTVLGIVHRHPLVSYTDPSPAIRLQGRVLLLGRCTFHDKGLSNKGGTDRFTIQFGDVGSLKVSQPPTRVKGLGFKAWGLGPRVQGLGIRIPNSTAPV